MGLQPDWHPSSLAYSLLHVTHRPVVLLVAVNSLLSTSLHSHTHLSSTALACKAVRGDRSRLSLFPSHSPTLKSKCLLSTDFTPKCLQLDSVSVDPLTANNIHRVCVIDKSISGRHIGEGSRVQLDSINNKLIYKVKPSRLGRTHLEGSSV